VHFELTASLPGISEERGVFSAPGLVSAEDESLSANRQVLRCGCEMERTLVFKIMIFALAQRNIMQVGYLVRKFSSLLYCHYLLLLKINSKY
jgi:hypothetical protein